MAETHLKTLLHVYESLDLTEETINILRDKNLVSHPLKNLQHTILRRTSRTQIFLLVQITMRSEASKGGTRKMVMK